jgi:hypothetical protein
MVASPNDTLVTGIGASVTDASGNVWMIDSSGQITVNGEVDGSTANVDELAYYNGLVWQKNADNQWYSKTSPAAPWVQWLNATAPVLTPDISENDMTIVAGSATNLVDANGNVWGLTETNAGLGYQVVVDGAVDETTANVVQMAIVNGVIWQENTAGLWYSKTTPASAWSAGTTTDPLTGSPEPISLTWVGGGNDRAANPADWSPAVAPAPGDVLTMGSGTMYVSGNGLAGDTLTISPGATADIYTNGATNLSLRTVEPSAHININIAQGSTLTLTAAIGSSYLNVSGGTLSFIGTNEFGAFSTVFSDNLVGSGTLDLNGGNAAGEAMEVNGSVGAGLTFDISSPGPGDAGLQIAHPAEFLGNAVLQSGYVAFMGIHATYGELLNGVLEMFNGSALVGSARFVSEPNNIAGQGLQMQQNSEGVMLSIGLGEYEQPGGIGTVLPLHT